MIQNIAFALLAALTLTSQAASTPPALIPDIAGERIWQIVHEEPHRSLAIMVQSRRGNTVPLWLILTNRPADGSPPTQSWYSLGINCVDRTAQISLDGRVDAPPLAEHIYDPARSAAAGGGPPVILPIEPAARPAISITRDSLLQPAAAAACDGQQDFPTVVGEWRVVVSTLLERVEALH